MYIENISMTQGCLSLASLNRFEADVNLVHMASEFPFDPDHFPNQFTYATLSGLLVAINQDKQIAYIFRKKSEKWELTEKSTYYFIVNNYDLFTVSREVANEIIDQMILENKTASIIAAIEVRLKSFFEDKHPSLSVSQIRFLNVRAVDWSDSSLGIPEDGQSYAQVITPGYDFLFDVYEKNAIFQVHVHTDATGENIRILYS